MWLLETTLDHIIHLFEVTLAYMCLFEVTGLGLEVLSTLLFLDFFQTFLFLFIFNFLLELVGARLVINLNERQNRDTKTHSQLTRFLLKTLNFT